MLSGDQWNQLLQGFLSEGRDLLKDAEDSLLCLESAPQDDAAINSLFRAVHTLKGSAGIFSLTPLVNLTHHLESLLMSVRDGQRQLTPALTSLMLSCMDELTAMIERVDPDSGLLDTDQGQQAILLAALAEAQDLAPTALRWSKPTSPAWPWLKPRATRCCGRSPSALPRTCCAMASTRRRFCATSSAWGTSSPCRP